MSVGIRDSFFMILTWHKLCFVAQSGKVYSHFTHAIS